MVESEPSGCSSYIHSQPLSSTVVPSGQGFHAMSLLGSRPVTWFSVL